MNRRQWLHLSGLAAAGFGLRNVAAQEAPAISSSGVTYLEPDPDAATSALAIVGRASLAHTSQMLPVDQQGRIVGAGRPDRQVEQALTNLEAALAAAGFGFEHLVRLHVVATRPEVIDEVRRKTIGRFAQGIAPALTAVISDLPLREALVGIDAVAARPDATTTAVSHHKAAGSLRNRRHADVSLLPAGRTVYISGQAEPGANLGEATRKTLESLGDTLTFLQLDLSHVVQVKCFLNPMSAIEQVERELDAHFADREVSATVHVEWKAATPIEIELVASAPAGTASQATGRISFLTPPGMKASPVYSRVTVIDADRTLYTSGLMHESGGDAGAETGQIFRRLERMLALGGSDFRHLAKATYYVADDERSQALNAIRPTLFDPQRPPAASKAIVRGVGHSGRKIAIDMIAVSAG